MLLKWKPLFVLAFCCALSFSARAQYTVEEQSSLWLRAVLDVRLVGGGPAPSWTDRGPGKLRYGGSAAEGGYRRVTRLALAEAALQVGASLPWNMRAQAQVNIEPDVADGYHPWLVEAILRKEWGDSARGSGVQSGVMTVPFSLEHVGPAWSPEFSISASALNSWLWEDIRLAGVEGEWWYTAPPGLKLGVLAGAGYGGDQIGRLLALRGWAMGDASGGINGSLALPGRAARTDIFNERDHRPTLYSSLSVADTGGTVSASVGFLDNTGDEDTPGVWHTHFAVTGIELHPFSNIDVLAQYLDGIARVLAPPNSSSMSAMYVLVSPHFQRHRLTLRYDSFRVHHLEAGPSTSEHGHAATVSYLAQVGLRHRIALEYIWMSSRRDAIGPLNPTPDGWQISYRFRY